MISADIPIDRIRQPHVPPAPVDAGEASEPSALTLADATADLPPPTPLRARPSNLAIAAAALAVAVVLALLIVRRRGK